MIHLNTFRRQILKVCRVNWLKVGCLFNQRSASFNQLSVITSFVWRAWNKTEEERGILFTPLQAPLHTRTLSVQGFSNWGRYDNTCYSVTVCVCVDSVLTTPLCPPPLLGTHTKSPNKKKIYPVSGDRSCLNHWLNRM